MQRFIVPPYTRSYCEFRTSVTLTHYLKKPPFQMCYFFFLKTILKKHHSVQQKQRHERQSWYLPTVPYLSICHICCTDWWVNEGHTCPILFPAISSLRHFDRRQLWTKNTEQTAKLLRHTHTRTDISIPRVRTALGIRFGAPDWHTLRNYVWHVKTPDGSGAQPQSFAQTE